MGIQCPVAILESKAPRLPVAPILAQTRALAGNRPTNALEDCVFTSDTWRPCAAKWRPRGVGSGGAAYHEARAGTPAIGCTRWRTRRGCEALPQTSAPAVCARPSREIFVTTCVMMCSLRWCSNLKVLVSVLSSQTSKGLWCHIYGRYSLSKKLL